jgi:proteasome lid subunit RPN8/RPN11
MILRYGGAVRAVVESTARAAYPDEGCGVLVGRDDASGRTVTRAIPAENVVDALRGTRYLIAPERLLAIEREARAGGLDVVGFFHSHPDHPARPSAFDLEHAWPYYSYLIVSVENGRVAGARSWRLAADRSAFDEEAIALLEQGPA